MSPRSVVKTIVALLFLLCGLTGALAQMPNPYGLSITLENAKKATMPALAEATKNNWSVAVAVVDPRLPEAPDRPGDADNTFSAGLEAVEGKLARPCRSPQRPTARAG